MYKYFDGLRRTNPFASQTEGDAFRVWVNDNKTVEEIANIYADSTFTDKTLGRSGSSSNKYVKKAWEVFGAEYEATL